MTDYALLMVVLTAPGLLFAANKKPASRRVVALHGGSSLKASAGGDANAAPAPFLPSR